MNIDRLLLTLAICGAGAIQVNAQTYQSSSDHVASPIVLTSQFDELSFDQEVPEVADDFQFEEPARPVIDVPSVSDALQERSPSDAIPTGRTILDQRPILPEPQSLPVGTQQHGHAGLLHSSDVMAGVTHVNSGQVMWNAGPQHNSAVGRVLMRTDCNAQQLWNGYPAEHAEECAAMWNCLNKNCGAKCGCSQCCGSAMVAAQPRCQKVNRYRSHGNSSACDSCGGGLAASLSASTVAKTVAAKQPAMGAAQQTTAAPAVPVIRSLPAPPKAPDQFAARPKYNTASAQYRVMR